MTNRDQFIMLDTKLQECSVSYQQAKQIATIKWLIHKAYDNNVPDTLKEPFYCDKQRPQQQPQQSTVSGKSLSIHLKPAIVYLLANAELYCLALANIYLDPNFHNLNHSGIIQALARKGVMLSDPHLTETVLLQTSPLKLPAHMCVIEAIMLLYVKEIATQDRIYAAIRKFSSFQQQRFNHNTNSNSVIQHNVSDYDQLLLLWISEAASALNNKLKQQLITEPQTNNCNGPITGKSTVEHFKPCGSDLMELCDGVALCALISFYCPQSLSCKNIHVSKPTTNADCIHNLNIFYNFCQHCLPYPIFHMMPQDIISHSMSYMRTNFLVLLADLFNVLEINPVNCVLLENQNGTASELTFVNSESQIITSAQTETAYSRKVGQNTVQKRPLTAIHQMPIIPNLRNYSTVPNSSNSTDCRTTNSSPKVDRKFRNNVSDNQNNTEVFVVHKGRNIPTLSSMNSENGHKDKQGETIAAGKPTNWKDARKTQLSGCGRRSRRNSFSDDSQLTIENFGGSHENINLLGRNPDKEPAVHSATTNSEDNGDNNDGKQYRCQVAAQENRSSAAITSLLRENDSENSSVSRPLNNNFVKSSNANTAVTNFSDCENTRPLSNVVTTSPSAETAEMLESCKVSSQMLNIRLKLEEKRKQIEMDKKRMEVNLKKQRQKLNKAAFLQAVSKIDNENVSNIVENCIKLNNDNVDGNGEGGGNIDGDSKCNKNKKNDEVPSCNSIKQDISHVEHKWLRKSDEDSGSSKGDGQTPDSDNMDIEKCQKSISEMDSSLHAIQTDLQWLAIKENEMLQTPPAVSTVYNNVADVPKSYPISFMLNQELTPQQTAQNQMFQKLMVNNHHQHHHHSNQNSEYFAAASSPNKNFSVDFQYNNDNCNVCTQHNRQQHHHSLLPTVAVKSSVSSPSPTVTSYDNAQNCVNDANNYYTTYQVQQQQQQQHQPLILHSHSPNLKYNYHHSMNAVENDMRSPNVQSSSCSSVSDDKENQIYTHQFRNEQQFYLHNNKPSDSSPFHFQTSSSATPLSNMNFTATSTPASQGSSRTWENKDVSSNLSPQHLITPNRYPSSNKDSMTFSKTFLDNGVKSANPPVPSRLSDDYQNMSLCNESPSMYTEGLAYTKKNFPLSHVDTPVNLSNDLNYNNRYNTSETDHATRYSSSDSVSVPTPSADDMAPQCISFIGSQSCANKADNSNERKYEDEVQFNENVNKLHISNGSRTYRIPSPTHKPHQTNSNYPFVNEDTSKSEQGFYVSFSNDDDNGKPGNMRFSERNSVKFPLRVKKFANNINSAFGIKNEKDFKGRSNSVKGKPESPKKPEVISSFSEKDLFSGNRFGQQRYSNDDMNAEKVSNDTIIIKNRKSGSVPNSAVGLIINPDSNSNDPAMVDEMERKKERILLQSLQRRQQQEESKAQKEIEFQRQKEIEKQKMDMKARKKDEEKRRRAIILERHRLKKAVEDAEREGKTIDKELLQAAMNLKSTTMNGEHNTPVPKLRSRNPHFANRPRPKTIHIDVGRNIKDAAAESNLIASNFAKKGSTANLAEHNNNYPMNRRDYYRGSQDCLLAGTEIGNTAGNSASSIYSDMTDEDRVTSASYPVNGSSCGSIGRRRGSSYSKPSRDVSLDRATSRIARPKFSSYYQSYPRKSSSLMNLCGSSCDQDSFTYNSRYMTDTDSGLGRATPPNRTCSPAPNNSSPSGPGSLPSSHHNRRLRYDDTASESGGSEYSGLRLYKQPAVKSNRGIIMNALEYCVFPGEVNRNAKNRILEEITKSDTTNTKHFLVLFRDARSQFRALYSYFPENEEVMKLYGTGPKQVTEKMFDKFFKYNSGGKCFTQVHTKHLTVTIDAFTIHNSLWQGKKVNLPNKRDMSLVI